MKKFIVMMAVVAFSALAFGDEAPSTAPAASGDAMKTSDASKTTTKTETTKKIAKKGKHSKKAKSAPADKAM